VPFREHLPSQLGTDPRPNARLDRGAGPTVEALVVLAVEGRQPLAEWVRVVGAVLLAQLRRPVERAATDSLALQSLNHVGVRMASFAEQGSRLCLGHGARHAKFRHAAVQRVHPASEPDPWRLALLLVVAAEAAVPAVRVVCSGHLPRQVRVPVTGRQLRQTHHRTTVTPTSAT
jgi:hypothetical protein